MILSLLLFIFSSVALEPNNPSLHSTLDKLTGSYQLVEGDCGQHAFSDTGIFDVVLSVADQTEFTEEGDSLLQILQDGSRTFDRPSFSGINQSTRRSRVGTAFISHKTRLSEDGRLLTHKASIYAIGGGGSYGRQELQWSENLEEFTYTYIIGEINLVGFSNDDEDSKKTCLFRRQ